MDKPVKQGVIPRSVVDALYEIAQDIVRSEPTLARDKDAIIALYRQRA